MQLGPRFAAPGTMQDITHYQWSRVADILSPASSPGPAQKIGKRACMVALAKIPVCAVSAVFVWSRGITFVHYQLLNSWHVKVVDSFQDHFKMGTRLADFSKNSNFRNLHLLGYYSCLTRFAYSHFVARSVHLLLSTAAGYHVIT